MQRILAILKIDGPSINFGVKAALPGAQFRKQMKWVENENKQECSKRKRV